MSEQTTTTPKDESQFYRSDELQPGCEIYIKRPVMVGFRIYRHAQYEKKIIERITPKRTKVYTTDGHEYLTAKTTFYKLTPAIQRESEKATAFAECQSVLYRIMYNKHNGKSLNDRVAEFNDEDVLAFYEKIKECEKLLDENTPSKP